MARVVVIGDLMTDAVAHAALPLARGSDTPASVTMHGGGSNATSPPSAAIQAAMLAPEPPPCMVTLAGVSLPRASGSAA